MKGVNLVYFRLSCNKGTLLRFKIAERLNETEGWKSMFGFQEDRSLIEKHSIFIKSAKSPCIKHLSIFMYAWFGFGTVTRSVAFQSLREAIAWTKNSRMWKDRRRAQRWESWKASTISHWSFSPSQNVFRVKCPINGARCEAQKKHCVCVVPKIFVLRIEEWGERKAARDHSPYFTSNTGRPAWRRTAPQIISRFILLL